MTDNPAMGLAQTLGGLELSIVSLADLLAKKGVMTHAEIAEHFQATADQLPENAGLPTRRVMERIADAVMNNSPQSAAKE